jgi:hypothetical protein
MGFPGAMPTVFPSHGVKGYKVMAFADFNSDDYSSLCKPYGTKDF